MWKHVAGAIVAGLLGVCLVSPLWADEEDPTWVASVRTGTAWTQTDALDNGGTRIGFSMELGAGLAIRENLILAIELDLLRRGSDWTGAVWLPAATFYPGLGGFHLRAGIGVSSIDTDEPVDPDTGLPPDEEIESQTHAEGFGVMTGLGYDWEVAEGLLLGPRARIGWLSADSETITFHGVSVGGSARW